METVVSIILLVLGIYLLLGILFTIVFLWKGMKKVDPGTQGTSLFFKLLLVPGMTALWFLFLVKWIKSGSS